jgi:hypothetical protein
MIERVPDNYDILDYYINEQNRLNKRDIKHKEECGNERSDEDD